MSVHHDINGKESSKRYWARKFFTLGFWIVVITFSMWLITHFFMEKILVIPDQLMEMWQFMMGFASAIIIGTVFEKKS